MMEVIFFLFSRLLENKCFHLFIKRWRLFYSQTPCHPPTPFTRGTKKFPFRNYMKQDKGTILSQVEERKQLLQHKT
jgi:hypothetical protein